MKGFVKWFRYIPALAMSVSTAFESQAQSPHFSQFYVAAPYFNPALAGATDGSFRLAAAYRSQWAGALDNPYLTFTFLGDAKFNLPLGSFFEGDFAGAGVLFVSDKVNIVNFNTNIISAFLAYHKLLDDFSNQYLSLGVRFGLLQKSINYENLTFEDQFNGVDSYDGATAEDLPDNHLTYGTISAGLNYSAAFESGLSLTAGIAYNNFTNANTSFYQSESLEGQILDNESPSYERLSVHAAVQIEMTEDFAIMPRVLFQNEGPYTSVLLGANLRTALARYDNTALHLGLWFRPVNHDSGLDLDATILMLGLELGNTNIGLSYDINMNSLINDTRSQGTFELSVSYYGLFEEDDFFCPRF
jgi:type IX secretion system PorP/SprF family membrane protein